MLCGTTEVQDPRSGRAALAPTARPPCMTAAAATPPGPMNMHGQDLHRGTHLARAREVCTAGLAGRLTEGKLLKATQKRNLKAGCVTGALPPKHPRLHVQKPPVVGASPRVPHRVLTRTHNPRPTAAIAAPSPAITPAARYLPPSLQMDPILPILKIRMLCAPPCEELRRCNVYTCDLRT